MSVRFFVGIHQPSDAFRFERVCISIHRLLTRRQPLAAGEVFVDSGAFTTLDRHGGYPEPVEAYAAHLHRLYRGGVAKIVAASAQDFMCEPFMIAKVMGIPVGELTPSLQAERVRAHQEMSVTRYDQLLDAVNDTFDDDRPFPILPVLQGYQPEEYVRHIRMYGQRLKAGAWVGVGSVCKRNSSIADIIHVLSGIRQERPDLLLHGFGLKKTALKHPSVRAMLHSADSIAWSYHARKNGRSGNDWREAQRFAEDVENVAERTETEWQLGLPLMEVME